ncbi:hypothetical protein [Streptomyces sp. NPDC018059]|uniref:hypothetical protein n=1 Tax=Streptomyces sp. NPDC018059 TaxID=3365041 RepID=UPI00379F3C5B
MSKPDPAAVAAFQNLKDKFIEAVADPTVSVDTVEKAAWDAHNKIEASGGDYSGVADAANRPG